MDERAFDAYTTCTYYQQFRFGLYNYLYCWRLLVSKLAHHHCPLAHGIIWATHSVATGVILDKALHPTLPMHTADRPGHQ